MSGFVKCKSDDPNDKIWMPKTWDGIYPNGDVIWTDGDDVYYSNGNSHYVLNKSTSTWSIKTWYGLTNFSGAYVWTDGNDIYYSDGNSQYVLDKSTSTWSVKTWYDLTYFNGERIWTDGDDIYYSDGNTQYILDKLNPIWHVKNWNGLTDFNGYHIWTDGDDIYYSNGNNQYVLNKSTSTWNIKTWNGLINFSGAYVWTDGNDIYYSHYNNQYVLNKTTSTWIPKVWEGFTSFIGAGIWTDGDIIYYSFYNTQKVLDCPLITSKIKKGWMEVYDKNKFIKITDIEAVQPPISFDMPVKAVLYYDRIHVLSLSANNESQMYHYSYDGSIWTEEAALPYRPWECTYVVYNDKIHMIGSRSSDERDYYHYSYDGSIWTREEDIPYRFGACFNATVVYNDKIYIIGGASADTKPYLTSWDGTSWEREAELPYANTYYASAVVYNDKIHVMGDYEHPDKHYSWNGTSWETYDDMPFNNYGGPSYVDYYESIKCINVLYGDKHYACYGNDYWMNQGEPESILPYSFNTNYIPAAIVYGNTTHLIGNPSSSSGIYHYIYNWKEDVWDTSAQIKQEINPRDKTSIYDNVIYKTITKRIKKAWVGEVDKTPKLVLQNSPIIENLNSLGDPLPVDMISEDYGLAVVSYGNRVHVLGGSNDIHYSFIVYYDSVSGYPTMMDFRKEPAPPYPFKGGTAFVYNNKLYIVGSAHSSQYQTRSAYYINGVWYENEIYFDVAIQPNKCVMVLVENAAYFFQEDMLYRYKIQDGTWQYSSTDKLPFYVDNVNTVGMNSAIYDKENNRIIFIHYWNGVTSFYSIDYTKTRVQDVIRSITLLKTVNGDTFSNSLYLDENVIPNGGEETLYLLGGEGNYASSSLKCYELLDNSWTYNNMPYDFYQGSAVVYDNKIHILGSGSSSYYTKHYSSEDGVSWTQESTLPYSFYEGAAVVYDGKIHILGCSSSGNSRKHYSWDGTSWTQESDLPIDFGHSSAVVYDNKIHILSATNHYSWDGTSWTFESTLPYTFGFGSAVVYDDKIHILGGPFMIVIEVEDEEHYYGHYSWDGTSWTSESELPYYFLNGSAAVYDNKIHILGGETERGSDTAYAYHYSWDGTSWNQEVNIPNGIYDGCAVSIKSPQQKYLVGWSNYGNYSLSNSGLGAFSLTKDPNLSNCISWQWGTFPYGINDGNHYRPAATLVHDNRVFMINIDKAHDVYKEPVVNELKLFTWSDVSASFDVVDDDALGVINSNKIIYDNKYNMYTYGGSHNRGSIGYAGKTMYVCQFNNPKRRKWNKKSITVNSYAAFTLNNNEDIGSIHNDELLIFTPAKWDYINSKGQTVTKSVSIKLIYNQLTNHVNGTIFGDGDIDDPLDPSAILYNVNGGYSYGSFSYNGLVYFIGGVDKGSNLPNKITKWDPINKTLKYVGRIWDVSNQSIVASQITLPYNSGSPNKLEKFGYGVVGNNLHMIYVQNGVVYHKILDLITEANYYQSDNKVEIPLLNPLRDALAPPENFCGPCFVYDEFLFAVCSTPRQYGRTEYSIYALIEFVYRTASGSESLGYRWDFVHSINSACELRSINSFIPSRTSSLITNVEMIYDDDYFIEQIEGTMDECFN